VSNATICGDGKCQSGNLGADHSPQITKMYTTFFSSRFSTTYTCFLLHQVSLHEEKVFGKGKVTMEHGNQKGVEGVFFWFLMNESFPSF